MDTKYLILMLALYVLPYLFYVSVSHGLGHKAEYLQLRRFIPCAILAVLPVALANVPLTSPIFLTSFITGIAWIITYPFLYFITYRKNSSDFGFHLDTVFGLYVIGWLMSLKILVINFNLFPFVFLPVIATIEFFIFLIPVAQWIYYYLYGSCINENGITLIQETYINETIEFIKSFPFLFNLSVVILSIAAYAIFIQANLIFSSINLNIIYVGIIFAVAAFLTYYLWKNGATAKKQGVFVRTGIIELYLDVKKYLKSIHLYKENLNERVKNLEVTQNGEPFDKPSTIIMVIGESESRDYMSAFTDYQVETTPWLSAKKTDKHFILFPNAYSCIASTAPCLSNALTEINQYNNKEFYSSCSVIDIAHKAGYTTHWYSNQGNLGDSSTAVTIIANTCETSKWTKQNLNLVQYDEALLEYLDEIDPTKNNFVVFHLKGNHFNFINRYPQNFAKFSEPEKYDLIPNYIDSIRYTDYILQKIWKYGKQKLNLQAMLYFSDHAVIPDKRRSPNFDGFGTVRIPMFTYFSDEYIEKHTNIFTALSDNQNKHFTNDLIYELVCGIFDVKSNHYDETNSLASSKYKYTRDMLKTDLGRMWIKDDDNN